jgi:sec-independent protein translocase protein TatA
MPVPGPLELIIVLVIALIVLGPGKLPDVGAALGKGIREFRKASSDLSDAARVDPAPTPPPAAPTAPAPVSPPPAAGEPTTQPKP